MTAAQSLYYSSPGYCAEPAFKIVLKLEAGKKFPFFRFLIYIRVKIKIEKP